MEADSSAKRLPPTLNPKLIPSALISKDSRARIMRSDRMKVVNIRISQHLEDFQKRKASNDGLKARKHVPLYGFFSGDGTSFQEIVTWSLGTRLSTRKRV